MLENQEKYRFKPYNKKFPKYFQREKSRLREILPSTVEIEHIGSTAVKGLGGKGIIDILVGVQKINKNTIELLEKNGYKYVPQKIKGKRKFFTRDLNYRGKTRRVHLHVVEYLSNEWTEPIEFREILRSNLQKRKEYSQLKKLASQKSKGKTNIYKSIKNKMF